MKIALQLYTVRDFTTTPEGLRECLRKAAELGYPGVQFSAVGCMNGDPPLLDAKEARTMLDEFGLECCATHRPWERFDEHLDEEIEFHQALRCPFAAMPMPPKWAQDEGLDGYRKLTDRMNGISSRLTAHGIRFGYHNHSTEFQKLSPSPCSLEQGEGAGGEGLLRPYDVLMERCSPEVFFLVDTYWVWHAGVDLVPLIESLHGRVPVVHVKDKAVFGWDADFAPIGEGNLPWDNILPAFERAGTEWLAFEQDTQRRDVWSCVESTVNYLKDKLVSLTSASPV